MRVHDRPFVHITIDAVDAVILDHDGEFDPALHDRYETFEAARDAALTSIEVMLDEADYDGEDHLEELERMQSMLEAAGSYEELESLSDYQWFLQRFAPSHSMAA